MYDTCFPEKKIRINRKSEHSPHIPSALLNSIKEKNRLEKLAYKWPLTYKEQYRAYRNKLTSLLKTAKRNFYQDQLVNNSGNPKSHWKTINNLLGRSGGVKKQSIELKPFCDDIPNKLNEHFLQVGSQNHIIGDEYARYLHRPPM